MADLKNLKHLSRGDLLEIMLEQSKQIDALKEENRELREKLERKEMTIAKCGSLAEASVRLSGIFEAAERAADIYLSNLEALVRNAEKEKDIENDE